MTDKERVMRSAQLEALSPVFTERLYHCTAEVIGCEHGVALRSYNTIVAWYDYDEEEVILFDRYSTTTTHHMAKFIKYLGENHQPVYNVFRLWNTRYPWAGSKENKSDRTFSKGLFEEIEKEGFYRWIHHVHAGSHPVVNLECVKLTGWNA